jgi:hypothetical protein
VLFQVENALPVSAYGREGHHLVLGELEDVERLAPVAYQPRVTHLEGGEGAGSYQALDGRAQLRTPEEREDDSHAGHTPQGHKASY